MGVWLGTYLGSQVQRLYLADAGWTAGAHGPTTLLSTRMSSRLRVGTSVDVFKPWRNHRI